MRSRSGSHTGRVDPNKPVREASERFLEQQAQARAREAGLESLPRGDHRGRAEELLTAITANPHRDLELAAHAAAAEAALAVADELAELRQLLTERLPELRKMGLT